MKNQHNIPVQMIAGFAIKGRRGWGYFSSIFATEKKTAYSDKLVMNTFIQTQRRSVNNYPCRVTRQWHRLAQLHISVIATQISPVAGRP